MMGYVGEGLEVTAERMEGFFVGRVGGVVKIGEEVEDGGGPQGTP